MLERILVEKIFFKLLHYSAIGTVHPSCKKGGPTLESLIGSKADTHLSYPPGHNLAHMSDQLSYDSACKVGRSDMCKFKTKL